MIHVVKVKGHRIPWDKVREVLVLFLFCAIFALAAFEVGWIVRDIRTDDTRDRLSKVEERQRDLGGRMIILEGKRK